MEGVSAANKRFKAARDGYERDLNLVVAELDRRENELAERLAGLGEKKREVARANGYENAAGDDLVEINAGGKVVAARRSTLTQVKGTRFEALFSGRWDKRLQRDGSGRIFLDVNPACFEAIVDYLSEMAISSEDDPPSSPSVDDENEHILRCQLQLFGFSNGPKMPESNIIKSIEDVGRLHEWLEEDGSDGEFNLLYRSSRDGEDSANFHSKCDDQGCTLTVIERKDGYVLGGYSNKPWSSPDPEYFLMGEKAPKAFLFKLSRMDVTSPFKMKLKDANDAHAVCHATDWGPTFGSGCDLKVIGKKVHLYFGCSYESGPPLKRQGRFDIFDIKEVEVFQVTKVSFPAATRAAMKTQCEVPSAEPVKQFSTDVNDAINAKQESLVQAELNILQLEQSFEDEKAFIATFASDNSKDVIMLNVNGTIMSTKRSTLQAIEDSVLAQQFDDTKWKEQGCAGLPVMEWTPGDVSAWVKNTAGIPDRFADFFKEHQTTGRELLALGAGLWKEIGIDRGVTLEGISKMQKVTLIEHSSYCFGKILDHLRLKRLHLCGLAEGEPTLPIVCDSQRSRFEKLVRYYFPGDSARAILG